MSAPATDPELLPILDELAAQEPIFHRPAYAATMKHFDQLMAPDYWEIGASGKRYTRAFILHTLADNPTVDAATANWQASDFHLRRLSADTFLITYTLDQTGRLTRRSTLWRSTPAGWQILYHQGTLIHPE